MPQLQSNRLVLGLDHARAQHAHAHGRADLLRAMLIHLGERA